METWIKKTLQLSCLIIIICTVVLPCYGSGKERKYIDLTCKLRKTTVSSCYWTVNNTRQMEDGHFYFAVSDTNTKDCSIRITNFDPKLHRGYWSCHVLKKKGDKRATNVGTMRIDKHGQPHKLTDKEMAIWNNANGNGFDSKHLLTSVVVILSMFVYSGPLFS